MPFNPLKVNLLAGDQKTGSPVFIEGPCGCDAGAPGAAHRRAARGDSAAAFGRAAPRRAQSHGGGAAPPSRAAGGAGGAGDADASARDGEAGAVFKWEDTPRWLRAQILWFSF